MTAATLSRLPLNAGGAVAGSFGRSGLWVLARLIDGGFWAVGRFMRAPVAISSIIGIAGFSILASSNALYFQTGRHPAPLFFAPQKSAALVVRPVVPAPRPRQLSTTIDSQTTGSVGGESAPQPIGNDVVLALQKKLVALNLLTGTPDGLFGRRTASAIRAFEVKAGLQPHGRLTREVAAAIAAYPLPVAQPLPAPTPTVAIVAPQKPAAAPALARPASITVKTVPVYAQNNPVPLAPVQPAEQLVAPAADPAPQALAAAPAPQLVVTPPVQQAAISAPSPDDGASTDVAMNSLPAAAEPAAAATPTPVAVATPTPDLSGLSPAQKLAMQMGTLPPEATAGAATPPATTAPAGDAATASTDPQLVAKIQRALASLGFLGQRIDGVAGEGTAKAIRNFEEFYNYRETGQASRQLLDLLIQKGATI